MKHIILHAYIIIATFAFGWITSDKWGWAKDTTGKVMAILHGLYWSTVGVIHLLVVLLGMGLWWLYTKCDKHEIVAFYIGYFFGRYNKLDDEVLEAYGKMFHKCTTDSARDKHFRKAIAMIFKRNNYSPDRKQKPVSAAIRKPKN